MTVFCLRMLLLALLACSIGTISTSASAVGNTTVAPHRPGFPGSANQWIEVLANASAGLPPASTFNTGRSMHGESFSVIVCMASIPTPWMGVSPPFPIACASNSPIATDLETEVRRPGGTVWVPA